MLFSGGNIQETLLGMAYSIPALLIGLTFHEAAHAFMANLFFNRITAFVVTKYDGGYVSYTGGFRGWFAEHAISLAPYFFPLFAFIFILMRPLLGVKMFPWWDLWIGIWITLSIIQNLTELKENWSRKSFRVAGRDELSYTDIKREGFIFSSIFILFMILLVYGCLLNIVLNDYKGTINFFLQIFEKNKSIYIRLYNDFYS